MRLLGLEKSRISHRGLILVLYALVKFYYSHLPCANFGLFISLVQFFDYLITEGPSLMRLLGLEKSRISQIFH